MQKIDRTGEINIANNGMKMTIIKYNKWEDIDIQFEDGTIVKNKIYTNFKKGNIKNPNVKNKYMAEKLNKRNSRIGETNIAKNGLKMTIVAYRGCKDIDIQFEDNVIIYNKTYDNFKKGSIEHPATKSEYKNRLSNRIGETNIATNGMKITIIAYRGCDDIDIQFDDDIIVYNKKYNSFKKGAIKHPTVNAMNIKSAKNHIGETNIAKNGLKMTIIAYKNIQDIDVQFEDGTIVYNKYYSSFKKGQIKHPNIDARKTKAMTKHTNEVRTMNCGQKATIINYYSNNNIDIKFENGIINYNKSYSSFRNGTIGIPNIINSIKLKEFAYKLNDEWYYICSRQDWKEDKILSVKKIYDYNHERTAQQCKKQTAQGKQPLLATACQ